jgi:phosphocarrier protein HPr
MTMAATSVTVTHPTGLHARPAVKLTKLAKTFPATIRLRGRPDGTWVDAKSIVKVMGLKLRSGSVIELEADGERADAAVEALRGLVERGFDEQG